MIALLATGLPTWFAGRVPWHGPRALAFSPDNRTLVTAGKDGTLKVWNLEFIRKELAALGLGWESP